MSRQKRIGIYSGTFNPVHAGHIGFALQALQSAKLDIVYFMPERRPRHKQGVEHFGHRVAMLKAAVRPHPKLQVLETDDVSFTTQRTLPRLQKRFDGAQLVLLVGSDVVPHMASWPRIERLLLQTELVIGLRKDTPDKEALTSIMDTWLVKPTTVYIDSQAPDVSSGRIREALRAGRYVKGLLRSVARYSDRHWLYVSLSRSLLDKA